MRAKRGKMAAETEEAAVATWSGGEEDEVAEEELRLLEAMTAVSTSMQQVGAVACGEVRGRWLNAVVCICAVSSSIM